MRIVLGLSDGVDSAVAAMKLREAGHEVVGVHLINGTEKEIEKAYQSAKELGIAFEAVPIREMLERHVCMPFVEAYLSGRTPSPCPPCNRDVKLKALIKTADELGIERVATGHYVLKRGNELYMGHESCDQSYMLCLISPEQLARLELPLGEYSKTQVRQLAAQMKLSCASRPDSRENCFIRDANYVSYIRMRASDRLPPEGIVLCDGQVFDTHEGIYAYTVGQRWRKDAGGRRLYVSRIDAVNNIIELCLWEGLFTRELDVGNLNWLDGIPPAREFNARIRIRHTRWETPDCRIVIKGSTAHVVTNSPVRAPVKGQVAAIYDGARLIGGGTVESLAADYPISKTE